MIKTKCSFYTKSQICEIFYRFALHFPNPKGELNYKNPFTLLIAVLLSAQATDISVNKATAGLFERADTPEKMHALGLEEIEHYIRSIGLWRNKAKNIKSVCEILLKESNGVIPQNRQALMRLPGVGRKTANVVLNIAFHQPTLAVDTHIFRIANRIKLAPAPTPERVEEQLLEIIPQHYLLHAHIWLILHGRYICKARKPLCGECLIHDICCAQENYTKDHQNDL